MKQVLLVLLFAISLSGYAQKAPVKAAVPPPVKLISSADSMQYTLGAFIGLWLTTNGFTITNQSLVQRAMDDIIQNRPRIMPDSTISARLAVYQRSAQKGRGEQMEKELFAAVKEKKGVGMFPNGVWYTVLKSGKGPRPSETDSVIVNLSAKLPDGTLLEDTYQSQKPFETVTNLFPQGINEAMQMMTEGSRYQLFIPAALAYGEKGTVNIPPNSALIVELELLKVKPVK